MHLWGDTCSTGLSTEEIFSFKEQVVRGVATKICGEFGVIPKAICRETRYKQPIKLNPYHRAVAQDALWLNYIRQRKFELAHEEAWYRQRPWLFWDPLIKASTFGLLERSGEGRYYIDKLLELRPDFPEKGGQLVRNFVKFDDVFLLIVTGLRKAGLKMR